MESLERLKGQKVLVTGGTGFIGSHVAEGLLQRGVRVIVPFRTIHPASYFASKHLEKKVCLVVGDIQDGQRMFDMVTKHEVDYIIHLAAQSIVTTAYDNPSETLITNILGTIHVLEAARRYPHIKGIIIASSDKAYGKTSHAYKETDPLQGDHPYEVSKSAADLIAHSYYKTYGLPVVVTRFGNIYGPGDLNFSRIIPGIMKTLLTSETLVVRSDGTYIRDYVYVGDVVSAYIFLLQRISKVKGEAFNVSSEDGVSVLDLLKNTGSLLRKKVSYTIANTAINEIPFQHLDSSKMKRLRWVATTSFSRGIMQTYRWYTKHRKKLLQ